MGKRYSNHVRTMSTRAEAQVIENSQDTTNKATRAKEYTSNIIGWILRGGVILSATIIMIGFLLLLAHAGGKLGLEISLVTFPHTLGQVWSGLLILRPQAIIASGLFLLIATPVITVTTSVVAFAFERDRRFVAIASIVLAILIVSLLIGKVGG